MASGVHGGQGTGTDGLYENTLEPVGPAHWAPAGEHQLLKAANGLLVAALRGDIDLATATGLRLWLDSLLRLDAPGHVVDLRPVAFIDSTGLSVLLRFRGRVLGAERGFALLCDAGQRRLLHAHGTLHVLEPTATLAEALVRAAAGG
ncbi:anti-sigma factor antagonist [Streptomyces aquilus]|uniref:Anti-sigma factor antagonist n=1 Tax=Streptomyces aquilus TaxID=2548456 RepID=A0A3S9HU61_9ACTN|nr:anti-sigma factor antagonist [Streptomyces aquilus]